MDREDLIVVWVPATGAIVWTFGSLAWLLSTNELLRADSIADWAKIVLLLPGVAGMVSAEQFARLGLPEALGALIAILVAFVVLLLAVTIPVRLSLR